MITRIPDFLPAPLCASFVARLEDQALQDGRLTAGPAGQDLKLNQQLVDTPAALEMSQAIGGHLQQQRALVDELAIRSSLPFMFNCYRNGMEYKPHADNAIMYYKRTEIRTDLSATVFLSDPDSYEGGALAIGVDGTPALVKLPAGGLVIYPSNTLHAVQPVTRGTRWAGVTWFQSRIRSHDQRAIYGQVLHALHALAFASQHPVDSRERIAFDHLYRAKDDLMRMWGE